MYQYLKNENLDDSYVNDKNSYVFLWISYQNLRLFSLGAVLLIGLN